MAHSSPVLVRRAAISALAVFALLSSGIAAERPAALNVSQARLSRVDSLLQRYVDDQLIPGAVALVLRDGKPVYEKAFGWSDKEAGRRMTADTIFRIASQTKAITSTAVLILV